MMKSLFCCFCHIYLQLTLSFPVKRLSWYSVWSHPRRRADATQTNTDVSVWRGRFSSSETASWKRSLGAPFALDSSTFFHTLPPFSLCTFPQRCPSLHPQGLQRHCGKTGALSIYSVITFHWPIFAGWLFIRLSLSLCLLYPSGIKLPPR